MNGPEFYGQNRKPALFAYIASAGVFILSLLGITFLAIGIVALLTNYDVNNLRPKQAEIILEENIFDGFTDLNITIQNAGYLYQISNKTTNCVNLTHIDSIFSNCNPTISTTDYRKTVKIKTKILNLTCSNDEKQIPWSIEWIVNSRTIKFKESYVIKILYSIKSCTSSNHGYINKILTNSTIEISGKLVFVENNTLIKKEYKNCIFTLDQIDKTKSCVETKNATIPYELKKSPIELISRIKKNQSDQFLLDSEERFLNKSFSFLELNSKME